MVSVIIPLYNVEKYIELCLSSFENQKYKDFEIVVINDGSTDNSVSIVEDYIGKSQMRIKLIHQKNSGVSAARNKGIDNSKGQYICFVDSDDMVVPSYLSDMTEILINRNIDMVICGVKSISEESSRSIYESDNNSIIEIDSHEALTRFLYRDINPGIWSLMINRKVIDRNNLRFAEGYRYSEDIEMIFKIIANSNRIAQTKSKLYLYRVRNLSVMSLVDDKRLDGFKLMIGLESYFVEARPDFLEEFRKFGVARWVWATLWQNAMASSTYNDFINNSEKYNAKFHMKKLLSFPKRKVTESARVYIISRFMYYIIFKYFVRNKYNREIYSA